MTLQNNAKDDFCPVAGPSGTERDKAIRRLIEAVHRTNEAILRAVDAGVSVELVRTSLYHDGRGNWGAQVVPHIREAPGRPGPDINSGAGTAPGGREA